MPKYILLALLMTVGLMGQTVKPLSQCPYAAPIDTGDIFAIQQDSASHKITRKLPALTLTNAINDSLYNWFVAGAGITITRNGRKFTIIRTGGNASTGDPDSLYGHSGPEYVLWADSNGANGWYKRANILALFNHKAPIDSITALRNFANLLKDTLTNDNNRINIGIQRSLDSASIFRAEINAERDSLAALRIVMNGSRGYRVQFVGTDTLLAIGNSCNTGMNILSTDIITVSPVGTICASDILSVTAYSGYFVIQRKADGTPNLNVNWRR